MSAAAASTPSCAGSSTTHGSIATVRRKTLSALVYPAILITLAIILVGIIVLKVVPAFSDFYASFGAQLPLVTRIIVGISDALRAQFLLIMIALAAAIAAFVTWVKQPGQKARFDRLILRLPVVGDVAAKFATSQMARTLATLLGGGLPLVNSLEIAARSIGNQFIAKELEVVSARVREGRVVRSRSGGPARLPGSGGEDGRSGRIDGGAAGHAQHRRRLLR